MLKTGTISLENMDVFKRLPYKKESILISEENFSRYTQKAEPYDIAVPYLSRHCKMVM